MKKLNSRKPKIKIISDGKRTKLWINGKYIRYSCMADLHFYAETEHTEIEYEQYKLRDGLPYVENEEIPRKTRKLEL